MLRYVESNLFESPAQVLVNPVNTVGTMSKGLALAFKQQYPEMFTRYQSLCEQKQFNVGQLWLYRESQKWVLNFPTKQHWRQKAKVETIELGLQKFVATYAEKGVTSIAFPRLGCGGGELAWEHEIKPLMEYYLKPLKIPVYIHLFQEDSLLPGAVPASRSRAAATRP